MFIELPLVGKVKRTKLWVVGALSAGVFLIAIGSYAWVSRSNSKPNIDDLTIKVESKDITLKITASGTITPYKSVNLSPTIGGIVSKLLVEQGDRVQRGQVIAQMDTRDLEGQLLQANASIAQAEARLAELKAGNRPEEVEQARIRVIQSRANLAQKAAGNQRETINQVKSQIASAQTRLQLALIRLDRFEKLYRAGAETRDRRDEAQAEANTAQAGLQEAQQRLNILLSGSQPAETLSAQAEVATAQQAYNLSKQGSRPEVIEQAKAALVEAQGRQKVILTQITDTLIRAPFAGIITQKYATEGAFVTPTTTASTSSSGTSTSIVALAQELEVLANVPEIDIGQIRPGQAVEIKVDAYPKDVFQGKVRLVAPEAILAQNVTSFQVKVAITTGQGQLRSGMNADLMFLGNTLRESLVLPTVAIATEKGQQGVYVPDLQNKPEFKPITIGSSIGNQTQVLEGVEAGQRVFIKFPEGQNPKDVKE
ncbi:MAG: biotin/lipoyl-binding protein [Acaryochloridaceae cyanobacterium SU_2_1]|nr:biotin/lipoyl-binding protein [Acaryochloridaceae cyanobacterium SU_2_1]